MRLRVCFLALAMRALGGCAGGGNTPGVETTLTVWNRSQFELLELRVHAAESYTDAQNLLVAPLAPEEQVLVDFKTHDRVTAIRQKTNVGELFALTTQDGLDITEEGYTLIVFDESFRLMEPVAPDAVPQ